MSKTQRKKNHDEYALSKNNGQHVRHRKRLLEEQESFEELKLSLKEIENARDSDVSTED